MKKMSMDKHGGMHKKMGMPKKMMNEKSYSKGKRGKKKAKKR